MSCDILLVDDDPVFLQSLARALARRDLAVATAEDAASALQQAARLRPTRAVVDLKLADSSGLTLIPQLRELVPEMTIVILTGYSSITTAVEAIKLGADNYLCKPASSAEILAAFELQTPDPAMPLPEHPPSVERVEWEHIQRVLADHDGNISATARALGMHRRTLQRKLQKRPVRR
ncbi:MAG TPA: response regulator transcription factor [Spongiibacteraceae bacterium]|jgi:two-component system response regulator RegA|nr:response regulator transcription factor [Spongiibacteraceae bacterium]HUH36708.1 response regulator transcription factor [Spongiibacteraceae bacterium]